MILLFNLKHNYYNFIEKDMIQHSWQNKMNSHFNFNKQMLSNIWTKNFYNAHSESQNIKTYIFKHYITRLRFKCFVNLIL